ncbi:heavy metal tolerance protein precursor [Drepanopeziza brunnea f. sp. 'multigermtubi' MB_m1]|uniref:Heavy metal tolerance protein n=1 Tax=Marssonina brunnea f. sp. multigermtubi (strain MB_m1) TaxID=1072389 RepID=K1WS42_MARBU|nr:heavy metal tolerance protein precursor [Drepanopeziza brunnea f. sp. 'multigermtubi' MB_m1]EKD20460.1 heavy metal tolerance protein precursor [Drepanopeziza brunnea f. sp. 'multigermtubi' MB_m1]
MAAEAYELSSQLGSQDGASNLSTKLLNFVHFYSSPALFIIFIVAFVTNSILSAENAAESLGPVRLGPGGKPLPRGTARKNEEEREKRKKDKDFSHGRKLFFFYLSAALLATFVANAINIIAHALTDTANGWWCGEAAAIYVCASAFFYSIFLISLVDTTPSPNIAHQITWGFSIIMEVVLLGGNIALYTSPHKEINSLKKKDDSEKIYDSPTDWEAVQLTIDIARVIVLLALFTFYIIFSLERSHNQRSESRGDSDEQTPLLVNGQANGNGHVHDNGTIGHGECAAGFVTPNTRKSTEEPAFYKPTVQPNKTWYEYLRGYSLFFPYLWPSRSVRLQLVVLVCFLLVILQRVVNIAVPIQLGRLTNQLANRDGETSGMPWLSISMLIGFKFLQGTGGILGAIRSVLWIPISQYSYRALTTASFEHVHSLSLDFHLGKRTGEVLSALSKGNAINNFLEQITFQVLPMIFDLGVAIVYFGIAFDAYYALVVAMITFAYLYLTIRMARWRSTQRRAMTNLSREEDAVKNDSLTSYETVKYFNAEEYEFNRYRKAVIAFQAMEYEVTISLNILNISQNMVFMTGLLVTSFISAYQVTTGIRKAGDFVTLLTYMAQLQQPLNFFGSFYRSVQSAMISGERLLELFKEQPTVVDELEAKAMPGCEGQISFQNVKFSYDQRKPALENLSFNCRPGTTTAFVGESGGGKSTVFRLLFRFYNTQDGSIQVDGTDVRDITIDSLRRHIGVVPQDTILFNETLMYNLKYANQAATDEQVYAACRAASIHDKIMAFPDQYETKVGERGLRLSGGEKQRVAIARTILKDPRIIMLDEATAALDSDTEQNIQEALRTLSQGRTMLVIAHRLSTITSADQIVVLHAGRVDEAGTHKELLEKKGRYYNMWRKQIKAERAEQQATQMMAKAKALKDAIMTRPTSSGNEGSPSEEASDNDCGRDNRSTTTSATLASNALLVKKPEAYRMDSSSGSESNFGDVNGINGTKPDSVDKFQGVETAGETLVGAAAQGAQNDALPGIEAGAQGLLYWFLLLHGTSGMYFTSKTTAWGLFASLLA